MDARELREQVDRGLPQAEPVEPGHEQEQTPTTVAMRRYAAQPELDDLGELFRYHPPTEEQALRYAALRQAATAFAGEILMWVPPCADRSAALRKVREALMTANAGIALEETP